MSHRGDNNLRIRTPEGVEFSLILAGPLVRFLAWLIDCLCIWGMLGMAGGLLNSVSAVSRDLGSAFYILASFLISIGYGILCEWYRNGQTPGKQMLRLRVMDRKGLKLQFGQVVMRNLLRAVDSLPYFYLVGGATCLFSRKFQRLGDLAAHTIVVRNPKFVLPDIDRLFPDKYNSLRNYPHLVGRLRQNLSADDAMLGLQALVRRDQIAPEARLALFKALADHYKTIVAFPAEASQGLSDERYVRNLVDLVYRQSPSD
jgi:uncharacterized RDD family membrane protein YckC